MNTTAYHRDTRFEIVALQQDANGYSVLAVDRRSPGSPPATLAIKDAALTPEQHASAIALFTAIEQAFEAKYLGWEAEPARLAEQVAKAADAERRVKIAELEALRLDALAAEQTATLESKKAESARIDRELAEKSAAIERFRQELGEVELLTAAAEAAPTEEPGT